MQLELFDQAMEELSTDGDLVNQLMEIPLKKDIIYIQRYRLPVDES